MVDLPLKKPTPNIAGCDAFLTLATPSIVLLFPLDLCRVDGLMLLEKPRHTDHSAACAGEQRQRLTK